MEKEYDVIIVGAGPGGSVAARECSEKGLKVLVIDRRQEIGTPVRCGEGLGESWMRLAKLEYDPSWCLQKIEGDVIYSPKGRRFIIDMNVINPKNKGYVIERKIFEKKLAMQAARKGAEYLPKTRVYDVIKENKGGKDFVVGVKTEGSDGKKDFRAKLVIAADGVDSQTARYAGIDTFNIISEVDSGFEYEMIGVNIEPENMIHIWLGNEIAPRGYVWVFPKGPGHANVGIGINGNHEKTAKYYLDKFIENHPEIFERARSIEIKGGCIPVGEPLEKPYANGLLIIGDAARMVSPVHGGGMGLAMESAIIAAEVAKKAIDSGDVSEDFLKEFADKWYEVRGNQLKKTLKVRKFFEKLSDNDMEKLKDILTPQTLLDLADGRKLKAFIKVFAKSPRIALLAARILK